MHDVVGRVLAHEDLFEDHLALGVDLVGPERRARSTTSASSSSPNVELGHGSRSVVRGVLRVVNAFISPPTASTATAMLAGRALARCP